MGRRLPRRTFARNRARRLIRLNLFAVAASAAFITVASGANGQGPAVATDSPPLTVRSQLVLVPALVRERDGALVYTLKADDFVLTDDGVPQTLKLEEDTGGDPLALVVVMEAGAGLQASGWHPDQHGDPPNRFEHLPALIEGIVGSVPQRTAVLVFGNSPHVASDFTADMGVVQQAVQEASEKEDRDEGAAILDSLGLAVDLLRRQPANYRRAILLLSETNDRGSQLPLPQAIRAISDTNTTIFSVAFSTGKAAASRYGHRNLPTKHASPPAAPDRIASPATTPPGTSAGALNALVGYMTTGVFLANPDPYPAGGCFAKEKEEKPRGKTARAYDCFGQLAPPLALAKMAAIALTEGMQTNVPKTVAQLTGGEYFSFHDERDLEKALSTIANHLPNRYVLSFQPHDPHPGIHALDLRLPEYPALNVTARSSYWADPESAVPPQR